MNVRDLSTAIWSLNYYKHHHHQTVIYYCCITVLPYFVIFFTSRDYAIHWLRVTRCHTVTDVPDKNRIEVRLLFKAVVHKNRLILFPYTFLSGIHKFLCSQYAKHLHSRSCYWLLMETSPLRDLVLFPPPLTFLIFILLLSQGDVFQRV